MKVKLVNYTPLYISTVAMGKCYGMTTTTDSLVRAAKAGHWSLLEHVFVTFDIEMSQKCLAQITRHRHLSFTVKSTRGTNFSNSGYFDSHGHDWSGIVNRTLIAERVNKVIENQIKEYQKLIEDKVPYQIAGYALPIGCFSFVIQTFIPSKETMIAMIVANYITPDNLHGANEVIKSNLQDYINIIVEGINKVK